MCYSKLVNNIIDWEGHTFNLVWPSRLAKMLFKYPGLEFRSKVINIGILSKSYAPQIHPRFAVQIRNICVRLRIFNPVINFNRVDIWYKTWADKSKGMIVMDSTKALHKSTFRLSYGNSIMHNVRWYLVIRTCGGCQQEWTRKSNDISNLSHVRKNISQYRDPVHKS